MSIARIRNKILRCVAYVVGFGGVAVICVVAGAVFILYQFGRDLPDHKQLADYEPPVMTRVHAGDGSLIAEYARERRLFVPIDAIPQQVIDAFLAAEDKNFYQHRGLDYTGIIRAVLVNAKNMVSGRRPVGASTITQQVAKNFLLTNEVSFERKIKEAILAFRLEHAYTKDEILELYLNEIYLGYGSYGIAAAALNYFDRSLDELTLPETAYLAALPKAPNNYHPVRKYQAAVARRNWVLRRMQEDGRINGPEMRTAIAAPLEVRDRPEAIKYVEASHFAEEVRRQLHDRFGEKMLYEGGLSVRTTLAPRLQEIASTTLRQGLIAYDRRHGWRGPIAHFEPDETWQDRLAAIDTPLGVEGWRHAIVLDVGEESVEIGLADGSTGIIPFDEMKWARPWIEGQRYGYPPKTPGEVVAVGDVVAVEPLGAAPRADADTDTAESAVAGHHFALRQVPDIEGALVALDPHTGRVLALAGGYNYAESQFNRAVQALRQPGSAFKPIVYAAALDAGFTPSSLIIDAPFVIDQGYGLGKWKPANSSNKFYGLSTLRLGIEKSRNLMTVRLAQYIGMDMIVDYARRFGVIDNMPPILSMALGAGETTLLRLTTAYAQFVNGGKRITPTLIDRIQDRRGDTVYHHDRRICEMCASASWRGGDIPQLPDERQQVVDPGTAYQIVSFLEGVVQRGTGRSIRAVGKPLAGKTGTTNDAIDTWFVGFSPDLAVGVFVGFDKPRTLGPGEEGSSTAAPIFRDFMKAALEGQPAVPFRAPPGLRFVRVDAKTGLPAGPGDDDVILEAFKLGTEPDRNRIVLDDSIELLQTRTRPADTSGIY